MCIGRFLQLRSRYRDNLEVYQLPRTNCLATYHVGSIVAEQLQMDILRCKSPELVRKEIWTHILAYNLIRTIIAQAASKHDLLPRSISFKWTLQTLEAFQPLIVFQGQRDLSFRTRIYQNLLDAIAAHRVANRPDRFEPRARKRRYKNYPFLMKSRRAAKSDILKGLM